MKKSGIYEPIVEEQKKPQVHLGIMVVVKATEECIGSLSLLMQH